MILMRKLSILKQEFLGIIRKVKILFLIAISFIKREIFSQNYRLILEELLKLIEIIMDLEQNLQKIKILKIEITLLLSVLII